MITENIANLKINKLTEEQYVRELAANRLNQTEIYLTPKEEVDLTPYATTEQLNSKAEAVHNHVMSDIVGGIVPIAQGGTGANSVSKVRENLNVYSKAETESYVLVQLTTIDGGTW